MDSKISPIDIENCETPVKWFWIGVTTRLMLNEQELALWPLADNLNSFVHDVIIDLYLW